MLEDQVAYLLQRYLGNYVRGLSKEALNISVWRGDVELTNMQLKPEALNALKLPIRVKAGFLGSVKLKVPWSRLGQEPVVVHLDRIFLLAEPATQVEGFSEDAVQEAKRNRIRETEMKLLETSEMFKSDMNTSWLGSFINTVVGNLKLSISNIHIRYEDDESNPGHPFAAGVMLEKLLAATVDDKGKETFVTGGGLEHIQKSVELERLAIYMDSDACPLRIDKSWDDLQPWEWSQIFKFGTKDGKPGSSILEEHSYILRPVSGNAKFSKLHPSRAVNSEQPLQKADVNLDDVTLCLSKSGYRDLLKLADNFGAFNQRLKYAHYRPSVSVGSDPRSWWKYAFKAVSDQLKKASGKMSWEQVLRYASLRKKYISLYAKLLRSDAERVVVDDNEEIKELDRELDAELIIQWRMLAHKFVAQSMESGLDSRKQKTSSWWPFGWAGNSNKDENVPGNLTEDDWKRLNDIIGYKDGDNEQFLAIHERGDVPHTSLEIHMKHSASKLSDSNKYLADLSCDNLDCYVKFYLEAKEFDVRLGSYRLLSPNGLLAASESSHDSLVGAFRYKPFDLKVDWSMVAKASPCYVTYLKDSINEIISFFESGAVSQTVALETAAAVQMTLDEVRRSAQQEVNRALKNRSRFLLDLDIAAPKITIPTNFYPNKTHSTKLLLDLGNLIIRTQDEKESPGEDLYFQFDLVLSDVSAFLVDGDYHWNEAVQTSAERSSASNIGSLLPIIDKCGVIVKLQQIRAENPLFPCTRLAIRLPSLGFHFSPARYHRLMQVAKVFGQDNESISQPWQQADFEGWLSVLSWKGMGGRDAVWQRRYICIVGSFLYVLGSPDSKSYKQYLSLRGKQLHHLSPDAIGGIEHVLAISGAERADNKILEDTGALVLRCDTDDSRKAWRSWLQGAIYRASGSAPITGLSDTSSESEDSEAERVKSQNLIDSSTVEKVFLTGSLDELKICFHYSNQHDQNIMKVHLAKERRLLEFRAIGGQVEFSIRGNDMFIGTLLKALEVEDLVSGAGVPNPSYLARSFIKSSESSFPSGADEAVKNVDSNKDEGDDQFYEAPEILNDESPHSVATHTEDFSSQTLFSSGDPLLRAPSFSRVNGLLPADKVYSGSDHMEVIETLDSFVKAQIIIYDPNSGLYANVDTQVAVTIATLTFYCRRPTIIAIMEFVNAINANDESNELPRETSLDALDQQDESKEDGNDCHAANIVDEPIASGLLGKVKSRVIFYLILNMARAQILLMTENGTKLATLSQDNFLTDIKVFPSSFTLKASLGNLRISDDSLSCDHVYFWACNMRDPGGSSFVELVFCSYSLDDVDYPGYDYSLVGELSEVRVIYLNRFLQEMVSYFMGLVPTSSIDIVRVKDRRTDAEKSFPKSEIEGSPALKLDLSLRKPIIIMPHRTDSLDYLKLDVVHITVQNTFKWCLGSKQELNAVHVEILTIQVEDINLNVGTGSEVGDSIIQDVKGVSVVIRRPLRDLLHQIPETEVFVKFVELRAALSSKEYEIVTECAQSNISETPNPVPQLKHDFLSSVPDQTVTSVRMDSDASTSEIPDREVGITMKVCVVIDLVELSIYYGLTRDASLATLQVSGVWLLYKTSTIGESFLSSTVRDLSVVDDREGALEELKLAIRKPMTFGGNSSEVVNDDKNHRGSSQMKDKDRELIPSMLILDGKFTEHATSIAVSIQRPQLLVALDFLLDVVEFFVPSVRSMLSSEDKNLFPNIADAIIFDQSVYCQSCAELAISPLRPLIVDDEGFNVFVYDGKGGKLLLQDRRGIALSSPSTEAMIYVGSGKRLELKNVTVKNGKYLDSCVSLGCNSSYSASEDDMVFLEEGDAEISGSYSRESSRSLSNQDVAAGRPTEITFELQAIGPELTFYNVSKDNGKSLSLSNKLLHAQLDAFCRLVMKSETIEMSADVIGFTMESNGVRILEPFDTSVKYSNASGKTKIQLIISDVFMNFSFSILRLLLAIEEDTLAFLRMSSKNMTITCSEFEKIGTIKNPYNGQTCAFWRPRAQPGFAILGDYLTPIDKPPTKGVLAVNTSIVRVKRPESFKLVWPLEYSVNHGNSEVVDNIDENFESIGDDKENLCSIWFPEAPEGYVSMGCVVSPGRTQPSISSAYCIVASLVSPCGLRDSINLSLDDRTGNLKFWRVDNSVGTFLPENSSLSFIGRACELRHMLLGLPETSSQHVEVPDSLASDYQHTGERPSAVNSYRRFESVASFRLIWWNQGSASRKQLSIWRPIVSEGMVYVGDIAVKGYEPPNSCVVFHGSEEDELYKCPLDFQLVGQIRKHRGVESISFWLPQAPPGFVSLGCIACKGTPKLSDFSSLRCIRNDMVVGDQFLDESVWDTSDIRFVKEPFSIWTAGNELGTFVVRAGYKKPPKRLALKLADADLPSGSDDTVIEAEIRTFSAALYDDYSGLMVPLCNLSLSSVGFSFHGRPNYMSSSVSFSLNARSYNDMYEAWEPLIETVDGLVRYKYNLNTPGAISQVRLTLSRDLNMNISASNVNMMLQAYASWNSLSLAHESYQEPQHPAVRGWPIVDVHHKKDSYIIPQNKIGQDIFIKAAEIDGFSKVIQLPSGDQKHLKVPVSKHMLNSHLRGNLYTGLKSMVTIIIAKAELPKVERLSFPLYTAAVRLTLNLDSEVDSHLTKQSAHTSGCASVGSKYSEIEVVEWNEIFYFKVDTVENYTVEIIITEAEKGDTVGYLSAPLAQMFPVCENSQFLESNEMMWLELASTESAYREGEESRKPSGRLSCAFYLSDRSAFKDNENISNKENKAGFFLISPSTKGPWSSMRLNYAAPAACWQFGYNLVASEISVNEGNIYVTIRSLVSVRNDTNILLDLRLTRTESSQTTRPTDDQIMDDENSSDQFVLDETFETETYTPAVGWVGQPDSLQAAFGVELPSGFQWVDEWHIDKHTVNTSDGWVYAPDLESLKWPESYNPLKSVNYARRRRWIRHRKRISEDNMPQIPLGSLKPGEILPLPLSAFSHSPAYVLQLRPSSKDNEYSWSSLVDSSGQSPVPSKPKKESGICVSTLKEMEELLCCEEMQGSSSNGHHSIWVCMGIEATDIGTHIDSAPVKDWMLVAKSPLSITNYLPLSAEFSVLEMQSSGHFLDCLRGVFSPGETVKIYNVDIRNPVYFSLLPQRGWLPIQEAVLISHPDKAPSKAISFRSSYSGRVAHLILEQTDIKVGMVQSKTVKVYSPYWLCILGCPPLTLRLQDSNGKRSHHKFSLPFRSKKTSEVTIEEISGEELCEGYTIASALNFRYLGLSASLSESSGNNFGPVKDLSPLGDMDGSVDLCAFNADGHCVRLFLFTKPCPYQSVPTKVISVGPYITFTNRVGENIFVKLCSADEPKILRTTDARVAFTCSDTSGLNELQVRLDDTSWSFPVQIVKEDTFTLVMKKQDGTRRFLKTEIRGYEEGSRFIVVFRLGSTDGPLRFENRTKMLIKFRQSGFGDDAWIQLIPFSTTNFSWEDPYGQKSVDVEIHNGNSDVVCKYDLTHPGVLSEDEGSDFLLHVLDMGIIKVARLFDMTALVPFPRDPSRLMIHAGSDENPHVNSEMQEDGSPLELIVEFGALGVSIVDHRPRELSYLYLERVFVSYSTGYDGGTTSRLKLILGYLQLDNQLPLSLMPVLLAPEQSSDINHPVFKMTLTVKNKSLDGVQVFPYMYIRVTDKCWRLNIHEPIIWAFMDFYNNLRLDSVNQSSSVAQVDPEIRVELINISEVRLKVALETAPAERPQGVLGMWSPIFSAVGNAFKIQIHLRKVIRRNRYMRQSSVIASIGNRLWRDLIHNPLHLIFSVDVLGMTSSTLASLGKGFAELSTDGQFLQLRSKQVWSRRIGGVGDGIMQGTEALAQGVAFGISGVLRKPVESARQNGLLGFAHGLGQAFLGFIVQPVSGALDFFSLTVDGIGVSCSRCLDIISNKTTFQRIRNPRAIHSSNILREYCEREATGQMILFLAEASRRYGCTDIFKEPSKYAWSDRYEDHFVVPYQRIVLLTNKRIMLLQSFAADKLDKKPCKILWDVSWEQILSLELAKAGFSVPSHLIIHLKTFKRSENFVRVIKCSTEESNGRGTQAVTICKAVRRIWRSHKSDEKSLAVKNEVDSINPHARVKTVIKSGEFSSSGSFSEERKLVEHTVNFSKIWSSEQESKGRCTLCRKQVSEESKLFSIWRPCCPDGYISVGDIARVGQHPPNVAALYLYSDKHFANPIGFDLVWRNCPDDYINPVSIWHPRAPTGYISLGFVAVPAFAEPEPGSVYCIAESEVEETVFEEQKIWSAPDSYPWACHIYQVRSEALHFVALRQPKEESDWKPVRVRDDDPEHRVQTLGDQ